MKKTNWQDTLKLWLGALLLLAESAVIGCKKLPKKAAALCVAAALLVAMVPAYVFAAEITYDIWVGGVQVTSANKDNVVVPGAIGSATYDPDTQTLTLNNFSYTGLGYNHYYYYDEDYGEHYYSYAAIYSKNKLIIKLVGNNTVFCEGEGAGLPSFCGVYTEEYGDLTICDDTTDNAIGSFSANRISSYGNLTIRDVNVTTMGQLNVLYSAKDLLIQKATVSAVADSNAITCSGNMTIENHSIVTATATDNGNDDDRGIYHLGTLTIKNSSLEIISGRKASGSFNENNLIPYLYFEGPYIVLAGEDKASAAAAASAEAATYTAKYVKIAPTYKITVNYGIDGIDNKETTVAMGDTISLETPVLAGYVFMGWYADADFTTTFDFDTPITATTTVYAKFADYEGDKKTLQDAIDALEADVTELNKLTESGGAIAQINAKISAIESQIAALNASLTDLSNKLTNDYATKAELTSAINSAKDTINSAIDALTVRVQDLEAALAAVNSKVDTNTSDVTALKSDVATLNTWKNEAQSAITALQTLTATQGADIARLNTAVRDLEAELAAANARIDDAEARIAALEGKVSALEIAKQNLDAAVAALNAAIIGKADTALLNQKVTDLIAAIAAAEDAAKTYADGKDTALQTQLTAAIAAAKGEAITAAENLVNTAKAELQTAINNKADIATLNAKVAELNAAIATAEATAKAYTDSAVTTLNAAIITAKDEAVDAAKDLVDAAKAQLQAAIDNKADTAAVNAAIANLQNAITALQNAKDNYIAADAALKAELEEKIAKAKQEAIDAAKGHIPYIGTNGNWWIGDADTGVDANGIKGDTGNGIASITTKKENGVTTITITFTDTTKQPVVFTISDGNKGDTGVDGVGVAKVEKTATNGNVDTYTITLTNGKTYTFTVTNGKDGADGKDGTDGKDGENGKDGLTPFIGENGNWWIGDTDTGVKAVAEQTAQKGTDTITVVSIVGASVALLSNLALVVWIVTKKKKILV